MPIMLSDNGGGGDFKPAPDGNHAAVCTQVIDLGVQQTSFGDKRQVRLSWEIDEKREDGKRFAVSRNYTMSLNQKAALRKDIEAWRGKPFTKEELDGFDLEKLLGAPALVNVVHNEKDGNTYANVSGISRLPKGMLTVAPEADLLCFSCDAPDTAVLEKLPEWLGDKVTTGLARVQEEAHKATLNGGGGNHGGPEGGREDIDDEIPF